MAKKAKIKFTRKQSLIAAAAAAVLAVGAISASFSGSPKAERVQEVQLPDFTPAANELVIFYIDTCPHCHTAKEFIKKNEKKFGKVKITQVNVATPEGRALYFAAAKAIGFQPGGVPVAVFGNTGDHILGFNNDETTGKAYEAFLKKINK
ncbi:MAG: hypothetical protein FWD15_03230 [Alphaproteobacteria bacterium]|nr:hypothetical protein [Alphaproteobacteria bacterium]